MTRDNQDVFLKLWITQAHSGSGAQCISIHTILFFALFQLHFKIFFFGKLAKNGPFGPLFFIFGIIYEQQGTTPCLKSCI